MRKSKPKKRYLLPDPKFNDTLVTKFDNYMMEQGKKSVAYNIFYDAIGIVEKKSGESGLEVWKRAMNNLMPSVEVKSRRVGGATYQVPMEVPPARQFALAMRWIVGYAQARKNVPLMKALATEIREAAAGQGNAIKKRDDTHKMAQANRAFAHFRF